MFSGIASLSVSSALWLTAMVANPLGAEVARGFGVEIGFGRWLLASVGPDALRDGAAAARCFTRSSTPKCGTRRMRRRRRGRRSRRSARCRGRNGSSSSSSSPWSPCGPSAATLGLDSTAIAFLGLGDAARHRRDHARRHRPPGRRPGDVHLVRRALHPEQPVEPAGLHGVSRRPARRRAGGRWPRRPLA